MGSLDLFRFLYFKGFYTSLAMFSNNNTFLLLLRSEMIQRITNNELLVTAGVLVCFLLLFGNAAREHILIAPFVFLKVSITQLWIL